MFRFFRRYQKSLLVVAGVLCMLAFTLADPLAQLMSGGNRANEQINETVVTWDGGSLTEGEVNTLIRRRAAAMQFIFAIVGAGEERAPEGELLRVEPFYINPQVPYFEEDTVNTHIMAEEARALGMVISDETVASYLIQLGRSELGEDDIRAIVELMSAGHPGRLTVDYLVNAVREEMLARMLLRSYAFAMHTEMPEQRFEEWIEANDEVRIEAAGIHAADSLIDVGEPTDKQLRELFDKYKDDMPRPVILPGPIELPRPDPAFGIPRKVTLHYLVANRETFAERIKPTVTDKEIAEYYEANKSFYEKSFIDIQPPAGDTPGVEVDATTGDTDTTEGVESDQPADESGGESTDQPMEETAENSVGDTGSVNSGDDSAGSDTEPSDSDSTSSQPESDTALETEGPGESTEPQSAGRRESPFRLVALQEEASAEADSAETTSDDPAESESEQPDSTESTPDTKVSDDTGEMSDDGSPDVATGSEAAPKEYKPLEEVTEEIRDSITESRVSEAIAKAIDGAYDKLMSEYRRHEKSIIAAEADGKELPEPPALFTNMRPLAEEFGLEYEHTDPPVSQMELRDDVPVGMTFESVRTGDFSAQSIMANVLFTDLFAMYHPIKSESFNQSLYITIKVADTPSRTPKFDEAREEVIRAWKMEQAAELAQKRATDLAAKAKQAGLGLKEFFADDAKIEVVEPVAFAAITGGDINPNTQLIQYRLSQPEGLKAIGPEFIRKVFDAKDRDILAIPNFDGSIAYVVRIKDHLQTREELREEFLSNLDFWPGRLTMYRERAQQMQNTIIGDLMKSKQIDWKRDPNIRGQN